MCNSCHLKSRMHIATQIERENYSILCKVLSVTGVVSVRAHFDNVSTEWKKLICSNTEWMKNRVCRTGNELYAVFTAWSWFGCHKTTFKIYELRSTGTVTNYL